MGKLMKKHRRLFAIMAVIAVLFSLVRPENFKKVSAADPNTDQVATGSDAAQDDSATSGDAGEVKTTESPATEMKLVGDQNVTVDLIPAENDQKDDAAEPAEDIVDESAKTLVVRVEESGCTITINAPEGSLPYPQDQLSVSARELKEDTIEYLAYLSQAAEALGQDGTDGISFARFFDIEILRNGEKIEPLIPVEVKIEYDEAPVIADDAELSVVHFAEEGTEVISDIDMNDDATEIVYEQESFSVTATVVTTPTPQTYEKYYALVVKKGDSVYTVKTDGELQLVKPENVIYEGGVIKSVAVENAFMWTYIIADGKTYLRYATEGYDIGVWDQQAHQFAYTFIAPDEASGIRLSTPKHNDDDNKTVIKDPDTGKVIYEPAIETSCIVLDGTSIHTDNASPKYLTINTAGDHIQGNSSSADENVKFYLANAEALPTFNEYEETDHNWDNAFNMAAHHQVNHIDISIDDVIEKEIPLAYGTYYNASGEKVLTVTEDTSIKVKLDVNVSQKQLRVATITAKEVGSDTPLNDVFFVTGYSANDKTNRSTPQVRIEGVFKVSNIDAVNTWDRNREDICQSRKEHKIIYTITAVEPDAIFYYHHPIYGDLYDPDGNRLYVKTDIVVSASFDYFSDDNECPPLDKEDNPDNYANWKKGQIPIGSGMDFVLKGAADAEIKPVAIEIDTFFETSGDNPEPIIPKKPITGLKYDVFVDEDGDYLPTDNFNIGKYVNDFDYSAYPTQPWKEKTIDTEEGTNSGLVYDYTIPEGMVYITEKKNTLPDSFEDINGDIWEYSHTYIETEYVRRSDTDDYLDNHVTDKYNKADDEVYRSIPEILGDCGQQKFNKFLEFHVHNVYDKVIPPVKEEVTPYEGTGTLGGVRTGEEITYKITYTNYKSVASTITIKDTLDENVVFVEATDGIQPVDGVLTWVIQGVEPGKEGSVTVKVRVKENVPNLKEVINGGDKNSGHAASVKVGDGAEYNLKEVVNPVYDPVKQEVNPYKGTGMLGGVNVGDSITYEISYKNYKSEKADIVITDKLDKNVEFVKCSDDGVYDEATHTVTWTLKSVAAEEEGTVNLTVKVLDGALEENGGTGIVINGGDKESGHATSVKVGTDNEFYVEEVINPVPMLPAKREIAPYEGFGVLGGVDPGTEITYEILFKNYKTTAADVVISDELDENVEFVEASDGGVYDEDTHTVTWTLKQVAAQKEGRVTLTVVVLEDALESEGGPGKVVNGGNTTTVKVGDDQEVSLDVVENPVPKYPSKKEIAPYEGNGVLGAVTLDDVITYKIYFQNYKDYDADVVITDQLDPNVEFVDASDDGVYDEETHTVTWVFENYPARLDGDVWVDVKVLESALESNGGPGKVVNGGETSTVRVGNDAAYTLEIVENPVPELPVKVEIAPYEGSGSLGPVSVGDEITYELFYKNYKDEAADIYIYDPLDYYVDFISASDDGEYDEEDHSVEWILKDVPAGEEGSVTLTVKVLKDALVSEDGDGYVINGEGAFVQVGDDWEIDYNIVQNPVPDAPVKRETAPYKGNGVLGAVNVGDEITYEIVYRNYYDTYQNIVIKDKLDPNVEFVRASDNGKYDKATHTVTWLLEDVPDGEDGNVTVTVKVLEGALKSNGGPGKVVNGGKTATVKVGDDDEFTLDMVENPVDEEEPPVVEEPPVDEEVGNLTIIVTEKGTGRPVPGAVVEVKNPKGKTTEYTTDEAGKVTLTDIPVGDYTVTIKKVPDGYNVTTDEVMTATVVAGKTTTVEFKIIPPTDTAVKTGDPMQLMPFMLVMLISMAGMILVIRRKRKQDR